MEGPLTVKTVPALWQQRRELFKDDCTDLRGVDEIDSAGVAFLVQWAKAQPLGRLSLYNVPENALKLIKTFKLDPLFELNGIRQ